MTSVLPYEDLPSSYIVLAGDWETAAEDTGLSLETRMRVGGFAVAASHIERVDHVIYTGGLIRANRTEAVAMVDLTQDQYTDAAQKVSVFHAEDHSFDTSSNAQNVRRIIEDNKITSPVGFITSETHMKRAHASFLRNGFEPDMLVPMTAEELLLQGDSADRQLAADYMSSMRYKKRVVIELGLRALAKMDPNDRLVQRAAAFVRPTNQTETN